MKVFKTYNQQLRILRRRGLIVPKNGKPKRVLERENYYTLINGYKEPFLALPSPPTGDAYLKGATFSEIKALYDFDFELKMALLRRILRVENEIKSIIAYEFSKKYGHNNYLKIANFESGTSTAPIDEINKLFSIMNASIAKQTNKHEAITHYMTSYGYVPLWVLVNITTFGVMSKFYSYMKQTDRQLVARRYAISDKELRQNLSILTLCRNKCAHDERLYTMTTRSGISNRAIHTRLGIPEVNGKLKSGTNDIYAVVICLKSMMDSDLFGKMVDDINKALIKLGKKLNVIGVSSILDKMGFPANWYDIRNC